MRAFSYYPTQPQPAYHALRDRLAIVRGRPAMWDRMLGECAELFVLFKEGAAQAAKCPEGAAGDRVRRAFLRRLLRFLTSGPLRLAPGAAARPPMNYSAAAKEPEYRIGAKRPPTSYETAHAIADSLGLRGLL